MVNVPEHILDQKVSAIYCESLLHSAQMTMQNKLSKTCPV